MGEYIITLRGIGPHDDGQADSADNQAVRFADHLGMLGHTVSGLSIEVCAGVSPHSTAWLDRLRRVVRSAIVVLKDIDATKHDPVAVNYTLFDLRQALTMVEGSATNASRSLLGQPLAHGIVEDADPAAWGSP